MTKDNITLYYREGSSDKVYQAAIEEKDGGCIVNFAYGRRGSTLQTGTKTASPVEYAAAKKIYDKLVNEKMAKGYTPGEDGTPYVHTDKSNVRPGSIANFSIRSMTLPWNVSSKMPRSGRRKRRMAKESWYDTKRAPLPV